MAERADRKKRQKEIEWQKHLPLFKLRAKTNLYLSQKDTEKQIRLNYQDDLENIRWIRNLKQHWSTMSIDYLSPNQGYRNQRVVL